MEEIKKLIGIIDSKAMLVWDSGNIDELRSALSDIVTQSEKAKKELGNIVITTPSK